MSNTTPAQGNSVLLDSINPERLAAESDERIEGNLLALSRMRALSPGTVGHTIREAYRAEATRRGLYAR